MSRPDALEMFFERCWDAARNGCEIGGDDVQEWGEELGLLKRFTVDAPCGEGCFCDEVVGGDFPTDCYRPTRTLDSSFPQEGALE